MSSWRLVRLVSLLLLLATSTQQVDIAIFDFVGRVGWDNHYGAVTCFDIPPGECCWPPTRVFQGESHVQFANLRVGDIAAIWKVRRGVNEQTGEVWQLRKCSGTVMASRPGPGTWLWKESDIPMEYNRYTAEGASYISLPKKLPVDTKYGPWLTMQGILGLVTGSTSWFSSPQAQTMVGFMEGGHYTAHGPGGLMEREIRFAEKGSVYARSPTKGRPPNVMQINGTKYTHTGGKSLMYHDDAGQVHNLTDWF
ncbi:MAG: hypothetical protein Q9201_001582 [Fulgogasparrea decipioides]